MHARHSSLLVAVLTLLGGASLYVDPKPALSADSPKQEQLTILPSQGLKECPIGSPAKTAIDLFGKPSAEPQGFLQFAEKGVEIRIKEEKVAVLFLYFNAKNFKAFPGKTDKGIGKESTMEDVLKQYGKPDRISNSIVSEFGSQPGAVDNTIFYAQQGVQFTFYDKKLEHITVTTKKE